MCLQFYKGIFRFLLCSGLRVVPRFIKFYLIFLENFTKFAFRAIHQLKTWDFSDSLSETWSYSLCERLSVNNPTTGKWLGRKQHIVKILDEYSRNLRNPFPFLSTLNFSSTPPSPFPTRLKKRIVKKIQWVTGLWVKEQ